MFELLQKGGIPAAIFAVLFIIVIIIIALVLTNPEAGGKRLIPGFDGWK